MSSTRYATQNLLTQAILIPLGIISSIIIARMLGVEGRGVYAYILLLSSFFIPILSFGYSAGAIYEISTRRFSIQNISFSNTLVSIVQATFIAAIIFAAWYFDKLGKTGAQISSQIIAIIIALIYTNTLVRFSLKNIVADSWFTLDNIIQIFRKIIIPLMVIVMIVFFSDKILGGAIGLLVGSLILLLILLFNLYKKYSPTFNFNLDFVKKSYAYGFKGWLGNIAITANTRFDQLVLGIVASAEALGNYSIAVMLSELIWIIPTALGQVIYNRIAGDKDNTASLELVKKTHRIVLSFLLLCTLIAALLGPCLIPFVYGNDFHGAILPFLVLLPGTLIMVSTKLLAKLFTASGHIAVTNKVQIISSIVSIILYLVLIPRMGILGAAIAATIGYIIGAVVFWYFYKKTFNEGLIELFAVKKNDIQWVSERCRFLWGNMKGR